MKEPKIFRGNEYPHNFEISDKYLIKDVKPKHGDVIGKTEVIHEGYPTALLVWVIDRDGVGDIVTMSESMYARFHEIFHEPSALKGKAVTLMSVLIDAKVDLEKVDYYQFLAEFPDLAGIIFIVLNDDITKYLDKLNHQLSPYDLFFQMLTLLDKNISEDEFLGFLDAYPVLCQILLGLVLKRIK